MRRGSQHGGGTLREEKLREKKKWTDIGKNAQMPQ